MVFVLVAALSLLLTVGASGAPLAPFSGFSELATACDLCDSFVNFTVYQNTDGNWTDDPFFVGAAGAPAVTINPLAAQGGQFGAATDAGAMFVYLFQVINTESGSLENVLRNFNINNPGGAGAITSGGFLSGVFVDAAGGLFGLGNFSLANPDPALGSPDTPNDGMPSAANLIPAGVVGAGGLFNPQLLNVSALISNPAVAGGAIHNGVLWDFGSGSEIQPGGTSSILFLTSNLAPDYVWAETESPGGSGAAGDVPMPTPEPTSLVLLGTALLLLGRRFRRGVAS